MTRTERKENTYRLGPWVLREDWPLWLILAASLVVAVVLYPSLPERVPTHWNIRGEIDQWGGKTIVFKMLGLNAGLYLLFLVMPLIDPRRENYVKFQSTYRVLRFTFVTLMTAIWGMTLAAAKGVRVDISVAVPVIISVMFIVFGNVMTRVRYNWFVGIRTPWSLANEEAWRLTHRVGGRAWVIGGLISLVGAFFGHEVAAWAMGLGAGGAGVFSVAYSYVAWKRTQGRETP
ncbi:MAG TPA: SdpI family protein [Firmicutes bacterium]|nr:SdpI family protein [Bacillota bacterium]